MFRCQKCILGHILDYKLVHTVWWSTVFLPQLNVTMPIPIKPYPPPPSHWNKMEVVVTPFAHVTDKDIYHLEHRETIQPTSRVYTCLLAFMSAYLYFANVSPTTPYDLEQSINWPRHFNNNFYSPSRTRSAYPLLQAKSCGTIWNRTSLFHRSVTQYAILSDVWFSRMARKFLSLLWINWICMRAWNVCQHYYNMLFTTMILSKFGESCLD